MKLSCAKNKLVIGSIAISLIITACTNQEELLLGSWFCESGSCPDEEISFSTQNGERTYDSWLHSRPSVVNGSWKLDGAVLTIDEEDQISTEWFVLKATNKKLHLQQPNSPEITIFSRISEDS